MQLVWPAPIPDRFWGPERLNPAAFRALVDLIDAHAEVAAILAALDGVTDVVDVGGGTGFLSQQIAKRAPVTVIDPSAEQRAHVPAGITVRAGRAEQLPIDTADAAIATWVLQYCDDPLRAIDELARVARRRVVVVQAAPGNDLVEIYNLEAAIAGEGAAHHGYLLHHAEARLRAAGFAVTIETVAIPVRVVPGLADTLARLHFAGHPRHAEMVAATERYIGARTQIADDGAVLVAHRE